MAYSFPRNPVTEFYLDEWRDVSLDVRQNPAITITTGRKDWSSKLSPAKATFTLDDGPAHGDGDYDPTNPLGQWFDYLGRSTPVRIALPVAADAFGRTVVDGWGDADTGETWANSGVGGTVAASDFQVASGVGTHSVPATLSYRMSVIPVGVRDVEVSCTTTVAINNLTGGGIEPANLVCRWIDVLNYFMARVSINNAEVLTLSIHSVIGGVDTVLTTPVTVSGIVDAVSSKVVRVKMQAVGQTVRAKVYAPGAEPLGWHVEVHSDVLPAAGAVGVRNGIASGNSNTKPIVFANDDLEVRSPRFYGETVKMQPVTDVAHADRRTTVEAAAVRRRLAKGEASLQTALRRWIERGEAPWTVVDYWPFDQDGTSATRASNLLGGPDARFIRGPVSGSGAFEYGFSTGLLYAPRAAQLSTDGRLAMKISPANFTTSAGYMLTWLQKVGANCKAFVTVDQDDGSQLQLIFDSGTVELLRNAVSLITVSLPEDGDDTSWHQISIGTQASGGSTKHGLAIDEKPVETTTGVTAARPTQLAVFADSADNSTIQLAQVASGDQYLFSLTSGPWNFSVLRNILLGRPGETADARFTRLCAEEGVSATLVGETGASPAMGAQTPQPLLALLDECVAVDQGSAFDPVGTAGLGMRGLRSTVARDPVLTLDYSDGQVAPAFGPITDDSRFLNDITAKRPGGGEYRYQQLTGPNNVDDPGTSRGAAGRADTSVTTNVRYDGQLGDQASWRVHLGTVDSPRYSSLTINLAAPDVAGDPALTAAVLDVDVDDRIDVTGAAVRSIYDDVRLIVRGSTESIGDDHSQHTIVFNTEPYDPLNTAVLDDAGSRLGSAATVLAADITSSATSFTVSGGTWTTAVGNFPMLIRVGGEVIRLSGISGATFTVDTGGRAVNGVAKAHTAGASLVQVSTPVYLGA